MASPLHLRKMMRQAPMRRRYCGGSNPSNCFTSSIGCQKPRQGLEQPQGRLTINGSEVGSGLLRGVFRQRSIGHLVEVVEGNA